MTFEEFCERVRAVCMYHGASVTSWGRSRERNEQVGGVSNSYHLSFLAVDVRPDQGTKREALTDGFRRLGLKVIDEGDHLHVQPAERNEDPAPGGRVQDVSV